MMTGQDLLAIERIRGIDLDAQDQDLVQGLHLLAGDMVMIETIEVCASVLCADFS